MRAFLLFLASTLFIGSVAGCQQKPAIDHLGEPNQSKVNLDSNVDAMPVTHPETINQSIDNDGYIEAKLLRFPDVSESHIVFSYASDLWLVDKTGGVATRLTSQSGEEKNPKFSPDGKTISFTAPYANGNEDVYTISVYGGVPKRLTFHPAFDYVIDWHPVLNEVLFRSDRQSERARYSQLFTVNANGGMPNKLPMPYGEMAGYSPDGGSILYSYLKDFQNQPDFNREAWKRYSGGRAPDIWAYNFNSGESARITSNNRPDSSPMWSESGIFFLSERENQRSNIFRMEQIDGEISAVTSYIDKDVTRPSLGPSDIVFELDGGLARLDLGSSEVLLVDVRLSTDLYSLSETYIDVSDKITNADISLNGSAMVFEARGNTISLDPKTGVFKAELSGSLVASRYPTLSSDGRIIAYTSDETGEYQLYIKNLNTGNVQVFPQPSAGFLFKPHWSPNNQHIIYMNSRQEILLVDINTGTSNVIDQDIWRDFYGMQAFDVSWSHDGLWAVYSVGQKNRNNIIKLLNVRTGEVFNLTSGYYNDRSPVFSEDGNFIYLLSDRSLNPIYGDIDTTWTYANSTVIAIVPLSSATESPTAKNTVLPSKQTSISIDIEGFESRLEILDLPNGNYSKLFPVEQGFGFVRRPNAGSETRKEVLAIYNLSSKEEDEIAHGKIEVLDSNSDSILVRKDKSYHLVNAKAGNRLGDPLPVSEFRVKYNRREEARQIINDARRFQRDFFYDPGLHGVDWEAVTAHYETMAEFVTTDSDLSFLLREMVGELSAGHVWAVAKPRVRYTYDDGGLLGADITVDDGQFVVEKILSAGPRGSEHRSPLAKSGLDIGIGDQLLSVNGRKLEGRKNVWEAFEGLAGQTVELEYRKSSSASEKKYVLIETLKSERKLRELDWVEENRKYVEEKSQGQLGYIYVPDTSRNGQNELVRQYRSQFDKKGLIIDERFNSGGALGDRFVELLNRPPLVYFSVRNGLNYPLPEYSHHGPKALIVNGWSYSGGDGFPLLFKEANVGPLIGTPTWGGLIGPAMSVPFVSGGRMAAPPQRVYTTRAEWAEPDGVQPDIFVENHPRDMMAGVDAQLDAAIENVLSRLDEYAPHDAPDFVSGAK